MENSCSCLELGARSRWSSQGLGMGHGLGSFQHILWQAAGEWSKEGARCRPKGGEHGCLLQGTSVWTEGEDVWRPQRPELRVRDRRLSLRVTQRNGRTKG